MSTQSVANNPTGPMLSQIPAIRSFEFAKDAIGAIKSSVNHFRGSVSLPIDFLTLPGRQGLDVKVSAIYSSNVKNKVATWNVEAPTGILGLGWEMPIDLITVFKAGSGSVTSDTYYLVANGAASPMVKTGEVDGGLWSFQLRNYEFWDILYDPKKDAWTIIKENGFTYTYGGIDSDVQAIQWGVKWGNWIGSSSQRAGQKQYPVAWNLASIESPWGHRVAYAYRNVNRLVGSDGLEFTQASYVKKVTDSYGRTITFNYGEKFGSRNPSPRGIIEYQAQNAQQPEPNAYQDKYETLYLDTIDVTNAEGEAIYTLKFSYDFINVSPTGDPNYRLLWKRCLQSVYQHSPSGATLPSICFEYSEHDDTNPGALKSVHYPTGGVARFCYKRNFINAPKKTSIPNPLSGSTPGVWHGNDYVVFTYCRPSGGLKVLVYSWDGRWVKQDITAGTMPSIKADPNSVLVSAQTGYIALSFRNTDTNRDELYVYRKDRSEFGSWQLYKDQPFYLKLRASPAGPSTFVAGTDFIIAYNKDYSSGPFQGFSYSWRDGTWTAPPPPLPSSSDAARATGVALAALQNYYIVAFYFQDRRYGQFQIYYRDLGGGWHESSPWTNRDLDVALSESRLLFAWSPQPTFAVATYVTGSTADKIKYSLRIFQWDENFSVLNASQPATVELEATITGGESQYDIFRTVVTGPFVNNNPANLRNVGGDLSHGGSVNWLKKSFSTPAATATVAFASGEDVAVMCKNDQGRQNNQLLVFNPNFASEAGWSLPGLTNDGQHPTVSGNYLTVGRTIYFRDSKGRWAPLQTQLNNLGDQQSVQNRGPNYIVYQDSSSSSAISYVVALKNGQAATPQPLPDGPQKIYISQAEGRPGNILAGARFLVSYPSSSPSFGKATTFTLYNLDEGDLGDFVVDYPVAYLEIEDAYDPSQSYYQSFFYANSGQSQIAYNPATGVTQYPLVTVAPGVRSTADRPPNKHPQGRSEYYYSNGLSPQYGLRYPQGWLYNYQNVLNGMLLARKDYDSENRLVSSQLNYWKVYRNDANAGASLYGGYVRLVRTMTETDGVVEDSTAEFDETKGVELWQEQTYYDAEDNAKKLRTEARYAWQVPEYAPAFLKQHIYTAIVQVTKSVTGQDPETRNYIESRVTTYRNWAESTPTIKCSDQRTCKLAPYQVYQWTSPGKIAPIFPFSPDGDRSDWLLISEIVRRSDPEGVIEEQRDVNGVPSSFLYDQHQRYLVAKFPNGSLEGGEVSYYGFEDYETDQGWILGSGAAVIPNSQYPEVDAHTGTKSLRLAPATSGDAGIVKTVRPRRQDQAYLFSAWVKKPSGFDASKGNALWQISAGSGAPLVLEFPDTEGAWVYVSQVINVSDSRQGAGASVEIRGENANTSSYILVDDLRFSPLSCLFEGTGYDTRFWSPNARLGANGESNRTVYDEFQQPIAFTDAADRASKITTSYYSRKGNQGTFSTSDPNHTVRIRPAGGGELFAFTRGSEWQRLWRSPPDIWEVTGGRLTQKSLNHSGTLSIDDPKYRSDYALAISFELREVITQPLGLHLGQALTVQWNPQTLEWQLLEGNGVAATLTVDQPLFALPVDPFASQLDAGDITSSLRDRFDAAGYPLPGDSSVAPGSSAGKTWTLKCPDSRYCYDLRQRNSVIDIYQVAGDWVALVGARHLVFWANGKRIFSYRAPSDLAAAPKFFFGNRVAISQLTSARDPQAEVSFDDSRGVTIQSQVLVDDREIVSQTITDDMGRQAARTKAAYVEPSTCPLFAYCSGFATLDWETGKMSGLVDKAYPDDDGYPYSREVYEASPLGRVIEQGMPGELFRAGAHSIHIAYTATKGQPGGTSDYKFYQTATTNPNGDVYYEIRTLLDQVIGKVSIKGQTEIKNAAIFDNAGNPIQLRSPNYYDPPEGSKPSDWVTLQTFDYAGRLTCFRSGDRGRTRLIYDRAGNLRFMQDPQGAKVGNFQYVKYNSLSRPIEKGYVSGTWNSENLKLYADTDPAWPSTPPTWRKRYFYDGNQEVKHAIGRVYQALINNTDDGQTDVIERFCYDVLGNTITKTLTVDAYDSRQEHEVDYRYDNLGNIIQITYPDVMGRQRLNIYYRNNQLNQVTAISETPDFSTLIATFAYRANGRPLEGTLYLGGEHRVRHTFDFNPPLWITAIRAQTQAGDTLFSESLSYTEDGFGEAHYYDGTIASASYYLASGNSKGHQFRYSYNSIGQIENAENTEHKDWNLGVAGPLVYDPNGNFETLTRGGVARQYEYFDGTQRVHRVCNPADGSAFAQCGYDDNGNVIECSVAQSALSAAHELAVDYDPATKMTTRVVDSVTGGKTLGFRYGSYNQRVLKEVWQSENGQFLEKKLYIRGTNTYPLCELTTDGASATPVFYIFGPSGLIAMRKGGTTYGVLKDHLGSVRAVLNPQAQVVASYDYLTFGALAALAEPEPGFMPYLYTGQEYDRETGLYNYRARFYSGELGRFIAIDPDRQYFSPYLYASNNPVLYIDPNGRFSIGSLFSAIGGAIIGAVEILVGVCVDAVAGVLEFFTGGLSTGVSITLASLAGAFYGAGVSAISYSVFNVNDFSWKDYGIQMGIGAVAGAISFGIDALGSIAAESATGVKAAVQAGQEVSKWAKAANYLIEGGVTTFGGMISGSVSQALNDVASGVTPGADIGDKVLWSAVSGVTGKLIPGGSSYKAGWSNLGKRTLTSVAKKEIIGISVNTTKNAAHGDAWDTGLVNTVVGGALWGSIAGLQVKNATKNATKDALDFDINLDPLFV